MLVGLASYAERHFAAEEKYMSRFNYPGYERHKKEHEAFKTRVQDFQEKIKAGKVNVSEQVMVFLQDWLAKHIQVTDKKYTQFFNANGLR